MPESINVGVKASLENATQLERQFADVARKAGRKFKVDLGTSAKDINSLSQPLGRITGQADEFTKSIEASNARVIAFGASVGIINSVVQAFKGLVSTTIEVEQSLAKINSILQANTGELNAFKQEIFSIAKSTQQSFATVSDAALELSRQGLSATEVISRLNDSLILSRLSGLSAAESVAGLTAAVNSFSKAGLTTGEVLNKISAAANKFAVSERDLIEGFKRSASVAEQAGVSIDELGGIITAVQQRTARGGAVIGNSFKTIFTRIGRAENLELLRSIGVEISDLEGNILPATKLIEGLAKQLQNLSDVEVRSVTERIGGGFQIAPLLAALSDYNSETSVAIAATEAFANATDEAYKKNIILNQTLAAAINITAVSVQELANTFGELGILDPFKELLAGFTGFVDTVKNIGQQISGSDIASSIFKGFTESAIKIGLAAFGAVLVVLSKKLVSFGISSFKTFVGIGKQAKELEAAQKNIVSTLVQDKSLRDAIFQINQRNVSTEEKRLQQTLLITKAAEEQLKTIKQIEKISAGIAPGVLGGVKKTSSQLSGNAAGGYLPVGAEKEDIIKGVGGAPSSAKPVIIPDFNFGKGKKGTMVANDSEFIVRNFGGRGDAIFNQEMAKKFGLPKSSKKLNAAGGYIPNFAGSADQEKFTEYLKTEYPEAVRNNKWDKNLFFSKYSKKAELLGVPAASQASVQNLYTNRTGALRSKWDSFSGEEKNAYQIAAQQQKALGQGIKGTKTVPYGVLFPDATESVPPSRLKVGKYNIQAIPISTDPPNALYKEVREKLVDASVSYASNIGLRPDVLEDKVFRSAVDQNVNEGSVRGAFGTVFEAAFQAAIGPPSNASNARWDLASPKDIKNLVKSFEKNKVLSQKVSPLLKGLDAADFKNTLSAGNLESLEGKIKGSQNASRGYIPNYAMSPLEEAVEREKAAGVPINQIRINQDGKLRNSANPQGLAVTNTRDEPTGKVPNFAARNPLELLQERARLAGAGEGGGIEAKGIQNQLDKLDGVLGNFNKELERLVKDTKDKVITQKEANEQIDQLVKGLDGKTKEIRSLSPAGGKAAKQDLSVAAKETISEVGGEGKVLKTQERTATSLIVLSTAAFTAEHTLNAFAETTTGFGKNLAEAGAGLARLVLVTEGIKQLGLDQTSLGRRQGEGVGAFAKRFGQETSEKVTGSLDLFSRRRAAAAARGGRFGAVGKGLNSTLSLVGKLGKFVGPVVNGFSRLIPFIGPLVVGFQALNSVLKAFGFDLSGALIKGLTKIGEKLNIIDTPAEKAAKSLEKFSDKLDASLLEGKGGVNIFDKIGKELISDIRRRELAKEGIKIEEEQTPTDVAFRQAIKKAGPLDISSLNISTASNLDQEAVTRILEVSQENFTRGLLNLASDTRLTGADLTKSEDVKKIISEVRSGPAAQQVRELEKLAQELTKAQLSGNDALVEALAKRAAEVNKQALELVKDEQEELEVVQKLRADILKIQIDSIKEESKILSTVKSRKEFELEIQKQSFKTSQLKRNELDFELQILAARRQNAQEQQSIITETILSNKRIQQVLEGDQEKGIDINKFKAVKGLVDQIGRADIDPSKFTEEYGASLERALVAISGQDKVAKDLIEKIQVELESRKRIFDLQQASQQIQQAQKILSDQNAKAEKEKEKSLERQLSLQNEITKSRFDAARKGLEREARSTSRIFGEGRPPSVLESLSSLRERRRERIDVEAARFDRLEKIQSDLISTAREAGIFNQQQIQDLIASLTAADQPLKGPADIDAIIKELNEAAIKQQEKVIEDARKREADAREVLNQQTTNAKTFKSAIDKLLEYLKAPDQSKNTDTLRESGSQARVSGFDVFNNVVKDLTERFSNLSSSTSSLNDQTERQVQNLNAVDKNKEIEKTKDIIEAKDKEKTIISDVIKSLNSFKGVLDIIKNAFDKIKGFFGFKPKEEEPKPVEVATAGPFATTTGALEATRRAGETPADVSFQREIEERRQGARNQLRIDLIKSTSTAQRRKLIRDLEDTEKILEINLQIAEIEKQRGKDGSLTEKAKNQIQSLREQVAIIESAPDTVGERIMDALAIDAREASRNINDVLVKGAVDFSDALVNGIEAAITEGKSLEETLRSAATSFLRDIARVNFKNAIGSITNLFGGGIGGAKGIPGIPGSFTPFNPNADTASTNPVLGSSITQRGSTKINPLFVSVVSEPKDQTSSILAQVLNQQQQQNSAGGATAQGGGTQNGGFFNNLFNKVLGRNQTPQTGGTSTAGTPGTATPSIPTGGAPEGQSGSGGGFFSNIFNKVGSFFKNIFGGGTSAGSTPTTGGTSTGGGGFFSKIGSFFKNIFGGGGSASASTTSAPGSSGSGGFFSNIFSKIGSFFGGGGGGGTAGAGAGSAGGAGGGGGFFSNIFSKIGSFFGGGGGAAGAGGAGGAGGGAGALSSFGPIAAVVALSILARKITGALGGDKGVGQVLGVIPGLIWKPIKKFFKKVFNKGGPVTGGSGNKDDVPALLMGGEYVMRKSAVNKYGAGFMDAVNTGQLPGFAKGGIVDPEKLPKQTGAGNYYVPGLRGRGKIEGAKALKDFASQGFTTGETDFIGASSAGRDGGAAFIDLEPESIRLTNRGRLAGTPLQLATQQAKQEALDAAFQDDELRRRIEAEEKRQKEEFKKAIISTIASTVLNFAVNAGVAGAQNRIAQDTAASGQTLSGPAKIWSGIKGFFTGGQLQGGGDQSYGGLSNIFGGRGNVTQQSIGSYFLRNPSSPQAAAFFRSGEFTNNAGRYGFNVNNPAVQAIIDGRGSTISADRVLSSSRLEALQASAIASQLPQNQFSQYLIDLNKNSISQQIKSQSGISISPDKLPTGSGRLDSPGDFSILPRRLFEEEKKATGGMIRDIAGIDNVPTMLSGGEFVINSSAASRIGQRSLDKLNSGDTTEIQRDDQQTVVERLDELIKTTKETTPSINITVNSDGSETEQKTDGGDAEQQLNLAKTIKAEVIRIINEEKRMGGRLRGV